MSPTTDAGCEGVCVGLYPCATESYQRGGCVFNPLVGTDSVGRTPHVSTLLKTDFS